MNSSHPLKHCTLQKERKGKKNQEAFLCLKNPLKNYALQKKKKIILITMHNYFPDDFRK